MYKAREKTPKKTGGGEGKGTKMRVAGELTRRLRSTEGAVSAGCAPEKAKKDRNEISRKESYLLKKRP